MIAPLFLSKAYLFNVIQKKITIIQKKITILLRTTVEPVSSQHQESFYISGRCTPCQPMTNLSSSSPQKACPLPSLPTALHKEDYRSGPVNFLKCGEFLPWNSAIRQQYIFYLEE